jgi:hypothetical protein
MAATSTVAIGAAAGADPAGAALAGALPDGALPAGAAEAGWLPKIAPIIFPKMLMSAPRKGSRWKALSGTYRRSFCVAPAEFCEPTTSISLSAAK